MVIIVLIIFATGFFVGYHRAIFSEEWNEGYYHNMSRFDKVFVPFMHGSDDINSHGAIGMVGSLKLPSFVVSGPNQAEQLVTIGSSTVVRMMRNQGSPSDLANGEWVVIIGSADQTGRINATFVRIVPPPTASSSADNSLPINK